MIKNLRSFLFVCAVVGCLCTSAFGQKFWEKKPYTEWSLGEVMQILSDSPWAQTEVEENQTRLPAGSFWATIRLRSALPIRQALLRQKQILLNYHKFSAADKARFDKETREFLECSDCGDYYIVTVGSPILKAAPTSPSRPNSVDIIGSLKNLSLDELKSSVYLANDKGERRELVRYFPPAAAGKEAMFVFRRLNERGKSLITLDNKSFSFKIEDKPFDKLGLSLKKFTFEVKKILQNGALVF
jgi:hypothetical protein